MKSFFVRLLVCTYISQTISAHEKFSFKPGYPLDIGDNKGTAILTPHTPAKNQKEHFTVDIRFINESGGSYFFNPFFTGLVPRPAEVALYDSEGNYIRNMMGDGSNGKSHRNVRWDSWVDIPCGGFVGTSLALRFDAIPPGKYSLQVIFYRSFISSRPTEQSLSGEDWSSGAFPNFDFSELFRSNALTLIVRDGNVEPADAAQPASKPAGKVPTTVQPPTQPSKDGPR